ncbi:methyltransferase, partial [Thermodesulfobacteriota bacterium]
SSGKKLTTAHLTNMAFAYKQSATMVAAIELGLFDLISRNITTIPELAEGMDLSPDKVDKLATACTAQGLLEKQKDVYLNSPEVDRYLVKGKSTYLGDWYPQRVKKEYDEWKDLTGALRRPTMPEGMYQDIMTDNADEVCKFTMAGYKGSIAAGRKLARDFDFSSYSLLLDLGGGSGCYSIPAVRSNPGLRAIVFDFPLVCAVTEKIIAEAGVSDRVSTRTGNFMVDELPEGADVVAMISNLHDYTLEETEFLIRKAFQALIPGGCMIIIDYMLNKNKTGPLEAALYHLMTAARSRKGWVKSETEMADLLKRAGAVDIRINEFIPGSTSIATGRKTK